MFKRSLLSLVFCFGCHDATKFDAKVPVGALSLHMVCRGEGTPVVVLESGLGNDASAWSKVQPEIAKFTKVCAYDRAGMGLSSRASRPHRNQHMADELHGLLQAAKIPGPYVLVGHSMGGTNVQLFLATYPESVAGMILVDWSPTPPPFEYIPAHEIADFERNIGEMEGLDIETLLAGLKEVETAKASLGRRPLVVLAAGKSGAPTPGISETQSRQYFAKRQQAQKPLLKLSTNSVLVTAHESEHHIPLQAPGFAIRAVRAVVQAVRSGDKLTEASIQEPSHWWVWD